AGDGGASRARSVHHGRARTGRGERRRAGPRLRPPGGSATGRALARPERRQRPSAPDRRAGDGRARRRSRPRARPVDARADRSRLAARRVVRALGHPEPVPRDLAPATGGAAGAPRARRASRLPARLSGATAWIGPAVWASRPAAEGRAPPAWPPASRLRRPPRGEAG